jgi:hypothetical protein
MATSIGNNTSLLLSSDGLMRKEIDPFVSKINFILKFPQLFIVLTGLFGNTLALIVINKKSLRYTSSAVFITYMAIFDSAVLVLHAANLVRPRRNLIIHCSLTFLTDLFTFCANWVLVIITLGILLSFFFVFEILILFYLERCVAVSSPFLAKRFCTVHSARYSIYTLITVAIIIFTSSYPIIHHTYRQKCVIRSHLALIYRIYQPIVMYGIPDILLLSNIFTIYSLIRRGKKKECRLSDCDKIEMRISDVNSNRKQRQLTIMLVTVNLTYYLFTTPAMIIYIDEYSPRNNLDISKLKRSIVFSQVSVLILQLHNAVSYNFNIYI